MTRLIPLVFAVALAAPLAPAEAAQVTYEFVPDQDRVFRYSGGLVGGNFEGRLEGTFDVDIAPNGDATITRFDVFIIDADFLSPSTAVHPDGRALAEYLLNSPIGLALETPSDLTVGDTLPAPFDGPRTVFWISDLAAPEATLRFRSAYHPSVHDTPAAFTQELGLPVRQIPEPATAMALAAASLIAALAAGRRRL